MWDVQIIKDAEVFPQRWVEEDKAELWAETASRPGREWENWFTFGKPAAQVEEDLEGLGEIGEY